MVEQYKKLRRDGGRAPGTINRDVATLRNMMNRAVDWGDLNQNPLKSVKTAQGRQRENVGVDRLKPLPTCAVWGSPRCLTLPWRPYKRDPRLLYWDDHLISSQFSFSAGYRWSRESGHSFADKLKRIWYLKPIYSAVGRFSSKAIIQRTVAGAPDRP